MQKPRLSFWQIWNMSFGFLGIQFGFALQNANVSRIFETLGANIDDIPILWIAAPVTGLIVQPIIGHMSDKTWNRLGRRRPFFLTGALLASLALFIMPNSPALWVAAGMLWIMDASINISMEPFRAFVGDMLPGDQRTVGFSMQSFFIGSGAIIASALPYAMTNWFGISNTAPEGTIPASVKFSFYIGGIIFFLSVLYTVITTKEYSPQQIKQFAESENDFLSKKNSYSTKLIDSKKFILNGLVWILIGCALFVLFYFFIYMDYGLGVFFCGIIIFGLLQLIVGLMTEQKRTSNGLVVVMNDLFKMPKTMVQLSYVQFFSWFALFAMWIYTTTSVTTTQFDMRLDKNTFTQIDTSVQKIEASKIDKEWKDFSFVVKTLDQYRTQFSKGEDFIVCDLKVASFFKDTSKASYFNLNSSVVDKMIFIDKQYNTGADWVGVLMAVYNGFAAVMAFLLIWLAKKTSRKMVHAISLAAGGIGLASFYIITNPNLLLISELGIGLAWASILAMPYAILTGSLPSDKLGVYMGIFNFFIVIPQITAAAILGFFVRDLFGGEAIYALLLGGISFVIAALLVMRVDDLD